MPYSQNRSRKMVVKKISPAPKPKKKRKGRAVRRNKSIAQMARDRDGTCLYGLLWRTGCAGIISPHHIISFGSDPRRDVLENLVCLCKKHHDEAEAREIPAIVLQGLLYHFYGYGPAENIIAVLDDMKRVSGEYGMTPVFVLLPDILSVRAVGFASRFSKEYPWNEVLESGFTMLFDADLSSSQRMLSYG
jgi:hypothetical protein